MCSSPPGGLGGCWGSRGGRRRPEAGGVGSASLCPPAEQPSLPHAAGTGCPSLWSPHQGLLSPAQILVGRRLGYILHLHGLLFPFLLLLEAVPGCPGCCQRVSIAFAELLPLGTWQGAPQSLGLRRKGASWLKRNLTEWPGRGRTATAVGNDPVFVLPSLPHSFPAPQCCSGT